MFKKAITKLILIVLLVLPLVFPTLSSAETIPNAPSGLDATGKPGSIEIVWQDNSNSEDVFTLWRRPSGGSWSLIAYFPANTTSYNDTTVTVEALYEFVVRAENEPGPSAWSNYDSASALAIGDVPAAPTAQTADAAPSLTLQKSANKTQVEPGGTITYTIIATNSGTSEAQNVRIEDPINPDLLNADTIQFIGPAGTYDRTGRKIIWTILPNISAGGSLTLSFSIQQGQTPVRIPAAPSSLVATAVASDMINLTWTDNSNDEDGFRIVRSLTAGEGYTEIGTVGPNISTYLNTGLVTLTKYYYRVQAYNAAGNSDFSNISSATTPAPPPPAAPSDLEAVTISSSQINLLWLDNSDNETGFRIERSLNETSGFAEIATVGSNTRSYSNTSLSANTTYYYRVRAYNSHGISQYSNTAHASTTDPGATLPAAPSGLIAVAVASDQINIAWTDNSNNETGFRIERSLSPDSGFAVIATFSPNQPAYSDVFLLPSTTYYYRVAAFNDVGSSGYSNVANATTEPGGPLPPSGTAMDVVTDGNTYAYVASNERGLVVIDIRNALQPAVLGSTQAIGFRPIRVARQGNIVAVAGGRYGASFVDVSNPTSPQVRSNVSYRAVDIALEGQYAYLLDDLGARLRIIDLGNPANPVLRSDFTLPGTPLSISVLNGYAYVSNTSALLEIDVRNPASPAISRTLNVPNQRVTTKPGWAYIDGLPYGGIQTVDLNSWSVVGQHQTGCSLYRYVVDGNMIYAAYREFWGSASGIRIMNVANPAAPFSTGAKRTEGEAYGIAASGNYAYLADGGPGLQIFNVQDPYRPTLVSTIR